MKDFVSTARSFLENLDCTCAVWGKDFSFTSNHRGVAPLLELLDASQCCQGFFAADKVVGKATALLYALLGVQAVYARVASQPAATVLAQHGITLVYDRIVPYIQNRSGTGMCPMEEATRDIFQPEQALAAIRKRLSELQNKNNG